MFSGFFHKIDLRQMKKKTPDFFNNNSNNNKYRTLFRMQSK